MTFARALLVAALLPSVQPDPQGDLLKTFREEFVSLPAGEFGMGSAQEKPVHQVTIKEALLVAKYEVPQNLWESVMGKNPSRWTGKRNSVEMLSFVEAEEFCTKVTALLRKAKLIEEAQGVRLPSEAEWEYFARAGTKTLYSFGDDAADLKEFGWFTGNAAGNDPPVGAKKPNPWKLHDVHGYLWEWCADPWHDSYEGAPADGSPWTAGGDATKRVVRGGSWKDKAESCTSSYRRGESKDHRDDAIGLRCVLTSAK